MKNILCVANDIGYSAAGIVFETIIKELQKHCHVYIISPRISDNIASTTHLTIIPTGKSHNIPWCASRFSTTLLGFNVVDYMEYKMHQRYDNESNLPKFDCILSFVAHQKYFGLFLGRHLSRSLKVKWAIYSVDAIPVPLSWSKNKFRRKRILTVFSFLVKHSDMLISANKQMLDYQLNAIGEFRGRTAVVYTPSQLVKLTDNTTQLGNNIVFLYTGSLYGRRRVDLLLQAFRRFVSEEPTAKMVFVGDYDHKCFDSYKDLILTNNIELYGYKNDLSIFYQLATVLIDMNADIPNDVFLSSKIANYLPYNKPILCLSSDNSPARNIFLDDESIVHCKYDEKDIYKAMLHICDTELSYKNRAKYIKMFSAQYVVCELVKEIKDIL